MQMKYRSKSRQCGDKRRHDTDYDARIALKESHGNGPDFGVYLCPHCYFWHVGHKDLEVQHAAA